MYLLNATTTLLDALAKPDFITAIILGILGVAIIFSAKRITKTIRNTNFISADDRAYVFLKILGVGLVLIAFTILIIASSNL